MELVTKLQGSDHTANDLAAKLGQQEDELTGLRAAVRLDRCVLFGFPSLHSRSHPLHTQTHTHTHTHREFNTGLAWLVAKEQPHSTLYPPKKIASLVYFKGVSP